MKRASLITLTALLILASLVGVASAAPLGPTADAYVRSTSTGTNYGNDVYLSLYTNGSGCNTQDYFFMKFDLSGVSQTVASATLTLTTGATPSSVVAGQTKVSLYRVADDSWTEAGLTYGNAPTVGTEILPAKDAPTANNQVVEFGGAVGASELAAYFDQEAKGDHVASIAVKLTGVCNTTATGVRFASKENATVANRPAAALYSTTAVTLSESSAATVTWPLYAGLAAAALLVVAGVTITRRRTA